MEKAIDPTQVSNCVGASISEAERLTQVEIIEYYSFGCPNTSQFVYPVQNNLLEREFKVD